MSVPMRAARILGLEELALLEPGFASLTEDAFTVALLGVPARGARLLVDLAEEPLAVAVSDGKDWYAASFLFREPPREVIELCERFDAEIHQIERSLWLGAVREYYSLLLAGTVTPALEDLPPAERDLAPAVWADRKPGTGLLALGGPDYDLAAASPGTAAAASAETTAPPTGGGSGGQTSRSTAAANSRMSWGGSG